MTMGPQAGSGPRGPMGSGSLGMGAMNNSLMPGGIGVSGTDHRLSMLHESRCVIRLILLLFVKRLVTRRSSAFSSWV